jgi:hypothetical protein
MASVKRRETIGCLSLRRTSRDLMQMCANHCKGATGPSMAWTQVALFGHPYRGPSGGDFYCDPCVKAIQGAYVGALETEVELAA